jgi:hypothetical protein
MRRQRHFFAWANCTTGLDQMSKQEQAVPRHCKGYAAQGVNVCPVTIAKTEYISEAAMIERDSSGTIAGTAKRDVQEPSSVGTLVRTPLSHGVDRASMPSGGEGNCPLWDGHIIDAILPLV